MRGAGLATDPVPVLVVLDKAFFNGPLREEVVDIRFAATVVAGVDADSLAQQFLDRGLELCAIMGQLEAIKGDVSSLQATGERRDIVCIRSVDFIIINERLPEIVCDSGLGNTIGSQGGVVPGVGAIAVEFSPIALDSSSIIAYQAKPWG